MTEDTIGEYSQVALAHESYGKLQEGLHITGYTWERACSNLERLLEDNNWKNCANGFTDINDFLNSLRFDQFRTVAEQRKRIALRIKQLQPKASNRQIAKTLGVAPATIDRDVASNEAPVIKNVSKNNNKESGDATNEALELSGAQAARLVERREGRIARDAEAAAKEREYARGEGKIEIRNGDFRGVLSDLSDVDAIITDPPYGKEYLPLLRNLAVFADKVLKPEGLLVVLYGHTYLPEAFSLLAGFRPYRWLACYLEQGASYVSHARAVHSNWKPILVYGGNEPRFADLFVATGDAAGKDRHHWGQNFDAFSSIVERLTKPGDLIVDPFLGGGTTLLAAKNLGRNGIGCDLDPECISHCMELFRQPQTEVAQ